MNTPLVVLACTTLLFPVATSAQGRPGSGNSGGNKPTTPTTIAPGARTNNPMPDMDRDRSIFVSGKVVMTDGSPVAESVTIESNCGNRKRIETYTDSHGNFSFELKKKSSGMAIQSADISSSGDDAFSKNNDSFQYRNCELEAVLPRLLLQCCATRDHYVVHDRVGGRGPDRDPSYRARRGFGLERDQPGGPKFRQESNGQGPRGGTKNKIQDAEKSLQKA